MRFFSRIEFKTLHGGFWEQNPSLRLAISCLLGVFLGLQSTILPSIAWILYQFCLGKSKGCLQAACLLAIAVYSGSLYQTLPSPGIGKALFSIDSIQPHASPFQTGYLYKGKIKAFDSKSGTWTGSLPCKVVYQKKEPEHPPACCDYVLGGSLIRQDRFEWSFKPKTWEKVPETRSLAEIRMRAKQSIRALLSTFVDDPKAALFLSALFTGELEDRSLRFEFGKVGLQHLLTVSGFHFAILSSFVLFFSRQIFPSSLRTWILLAVLFAYFLFVGDSPPVQRSFLAACLAIFGRLIKRRPCGLNLLGACLAVEIALNPLAVYHLGFQLSFLSCFGILFLNPLFNEWLRRFFPIRPLDRLSSWPLSSQAAYLASCFFTQTLSLTLAVNAALAPLLLIHFHKFPWLSLVYNLIVPELAALSLFLFLCAALLYLYHPLFGIPVFKISNFLVSNLLEFVSNPPPPLDINLFLQLPPWALAPWLALLLFAGLYAKGAPARLTYFAQIK